MSNRVDAFKDSIGLLLRSYYSMGGQREEATVALGFWLEMTLNEIPESHQAMARRAVHLMLCAGMPSNEVVKEMLKDD